MDKSTVVNLSILLIQAFPKMTKGTSELILNRMIANGFTSKRATDAVYSVIDTYEGWDKLPNVANFIRFDKKVKLYTYKEADYAVQQGKHSESDFAIARIEELSGCKSADEAGKKPLYILRTDAIKHGIETRDFKPTEGWKD